MARVTRVENATEDIALDGPLLLKIPDSKLVAHLFALEQQLQHTLIPIHSPSSFIDALLGDRFIRSPSPDVQQLIGCILCNLVRLSQIPIPSSGARNKKLSGSEMEVQSEEKPSGHMGLPLPFSSSQCIVVVQCLVKPFEEAARYGDVMRRCHRLIECMSFTRVMQILLPRCHPGDFEVEMSELVAPLFSVLQTSSSMPSSMVPSSSSVSSPAFRDTPENNEALAVSFSRVLSDVIRATHCLTSSQLTTLLSEVVKASPTLRKSKSIAGWQNAPASFGSLTACRVLLECLDTVVDVLKDFVMNELLSSVSILAANNIHERPDQRSQALHGISQSLEYLVAMAELHVDFVRQLLPNLDALAIQGDTDIRRVLLRGLGMTYLCDRRIALSCRSSFEQFAAHMDDGKPQIRVEMLEFLEKFIHTSKTQWSSEDSGKSETQYTLWWNLIQRMLERLLDSHPSVRLQAVNSVGNTLYLIPELVRQSGELSDVETQKELEQTLGKRMADKHPRVRDAALFQLCRLYQSWSEYFPWVPNFILSLAAHSDEATNASVVVMLEKLLPSHDASISTSRRGTSAKDLPLFDFEKKNRDKRQEDFITVEVEGWKHFCSHLSPPAFRTLLKQAERKVSLRAAVRTLYQFRQQLVSDGDVHSEAGKTLLNNMRRLMHFLQSVTGAVKNEWDTLFRCKDRKVESALLLCCNESTDDWSTARAEFLDVLKGRVDNDTLTFAQERLIRLLAFPIGAQHFHTALNELLCSPDEAVIRVVHVLLTATPSYVQVAAPVLFEALLNTLTGEKQNSGDRKAGKSVDSPSFCIALLDLVAAIPVAMKRGLLCTEQAKSGNGQAMIVQSLLDTSSAPVFQALKRICLGQYYFSCAMSTEEVGATAKKAATALLVLSDMLDAKRKDALRSSLSKNILQRVQGDHPRLDTLEQQISLLCLLQSIRVLVCNAAVQARSTACAEENSCLLSSTSLEEVITALGMILLDVSNHKVMKRGEGQQGKRSRVEREKETAAKVENTHRMGLMADCTAKAISSVALSAPVAEQASHITHAMDIFLACYKKIVNCQAEDEESDNRFIRLAVLQQLVKLVRLPSCDVVKDMAVAVVLSSEGDAIIRRVLQQKFLAHILRYSCDMRYVTHLLLLAMNTCNKNEYQELKLVVEKVATHLRKKQAADGGISLSSPKAMCCYLEYTLPFIVLFLAHHPAFEEQEETQHFFAFQRVWHVVLEELLSPGLQCVSFVGELLARLKQAKDALDTQRNRTRTIAELGLAVLQQLLSKHEVGAAELLKKFPGTILLPNFFLTVSPAQHPNTSRDDSSQETYLDNAVQIPTHVPFRLPLAEPSISPVPPSLPPRSSLPKGGGSEQTAAVAFREGIKRPRPPSSTAEQVHSGSSSASRSRSRSSPSKSRKTEPTPAVLFPEISSNENHNIKLYEAIQQTVNSMTSGLNKPQIAQLRWKDIRVQIEKCATTLQNNSELNMEEILSYAKKRLKEKYANAPL